MPARILCYALILLTSTGAFAQADPTELADSFESAVATPKAELSGFWAKILRGVGIAVPTAEPASAAEQLAERQAQIAAIAEENRQRQAQLEALTESVREADAELARRTAEQAELADRLDRLEALMSGQDDQD